MKHTTLELTKEETLLLMAAVGNCSFRTPDIDAMQIKLRKLYGNAFSRRHSLMSNYIQDTYHPETGELCSASWLDDHFGRHKYGVKFPDGKVFPAEQCRTVKEGNNDQTGVTVE